MRATSAPACARTRAIARPIPRVPPVMSADLPDRSIVRMSGVYPARRTPRLVVESEIRSSEQRWETPDSLGNVKGVTVVTEVRVEQACSRPLAVVRRQARAEDLAQVVPAACGTVWNVIRAQKVTGAG